MLESRMPSSVTEPVVVYVGEMFLRKVLTVDKRPVTTELTHWSHGNITCLSWCQRPMTETGFKFFILGDTFIDILVNGVPHLPKAWGTDTLVESVGMAIGGAALNVAHLLGTIGGFQTEFCSIGTTTHTLNKHFTFCFCAHQPFCWTSNSNFFFSW